MTRFIIKLLLFIVIIAIAGIASSHFFYNLLKKDKPLNSNVLLIEAWNSAYVIEQAKNRFINDNYDHFIVVGSKYNYNTLKSNKKISPIIRSKYSLYKNGYLSVDTSWFTNKAESTNIITIDAKGREVLGINAHFYLVINNKIVGSSFAYSEYSKHQFIWKNQGEPISSFNILFTNDTYVSGTDRNLYVRGIKFNEDLVPLTDSIIKLTQLKERTEMPEFVAFNSLAESTGKYLEELGVSKNKITVLSSEYYSSNKTLSNARCFASWLEKSSFRNEPINIFSFDIHTRRTYVTFKSEIKGNVQLGTIISRDLTYTDDKWWKSKQRTKLFIYELIDYFISLILSIF